MTVFCPFFLKSLYYSHDENLCVIQVEKSRLTLKEAFHMERWKFITHCPRFLLGIEEKHRLQHQQSIPSFSPGSGDLLIECNGDPRRHWVRSAPSARAGKNKCRMSVVSPYFITTYCLRGLCVCLRAWLCVCVCAHVCPHEKVFDKRMIIYSYPFFIEYFIFQNSMREL